MLRQILHLWIDGFPVAVERLRDGSLRKKPVVVCARYSPRSLIFSASCEARTEGVFKGMVLTEALKRCKRLVVLPPDEKLYQKAGEEISRVMTRFSPLVEAGHYGQFYVDLTGTQRLFGHVEDSAFRIRREIYNAVELAGPIGIGSNKLISSVASRVVSCHGDLCAVPFGSEASFLAPLRVRMLPAVRSHVESVLLDELNIRFVQQLTGISVVQLATVLGRLGPLLYRQARGIDNRPVRPPCSQPFILEEKTLEEDTNDDGALSSILYGMVEQACRQMRQQELLPRTVWLHLRYSDGFDVTRCLRLKHPRTTDPQLFRILEPFFFKTNERRQRVRYLSVTFTDLEGMPSQLSLFETLEKVRKEENLIQTLDKIYAKYGEGAVRFGRVMHG